MAERAERVREIQRLRADGLLTREIAERLGLSHSTVRSYLSDPDLEAQRANRVRYGRRCENCGRRTDGSNGRAKAPRLCESCFHASREPEHGNASRYTSAKWRCRCAECRAANTARHREWRKAKEGTAA